MVTEEQMGNLAEFMGWNLGEIFENGEYTQCWVNEDNDFCIPVDFWNPDSDMSDAWILVNQVRCLGEKSMNEFQGWLSLLSHGDNGGEVQIRTSIFDLTPELICTAILKLSTGL